MWNTASKKDLMYRKSNEGTNRRQRQTQSFSGKEADEFHHMKRGTDYRRSANVRTDLATSFAGTLPDGATHPAMTEPTYIHSKHADVDQIDFGEADTNHHMERREDINRSEDVKTDPASVLAGILRGGLKRQTRTDPAHIHSSASVESDRITSTETDDKIQHTTRGDELKPDPGNRLAGILRSGLKRSTISDPTYAYSTTGVEADLTPSDGAVGGRKQEEPSSYIDSGPVSTVGGRKQEEPSSYIDSGPASTVGGRKQDEPGSYIDSGPASTFEGNKTEDRANLHYAGVVGGKKRDIKPRVERSATFNVREGRKLKPPPVAPKPKRHSYTASRLDRDVTCNVNRPNSVFVCNPKQESTYDENTRLSTQCDKTQSYTIGDKTKDFDDKTNILDTVTDTLGDQTDVFCADTRTLADKTDTHENKTYIHNNRTYAFDNNTNALDNQTDTLVDQRDTLHNQADTLHNQADTLGNQTDTLDKQTDTLNDQTKTLGDQTNTRGDQTDTLHNQTDTLGDRTDTLGDQTDTLGDQTDTLGDQTDISGNQTYTLGNQTDTLDKQTDTLDDQTETLGDQTNTLGDQTDTLDNQTYTLGDQSDTLDKQTDTLDDQTDISGNRTETLGDQTDTIGGQTNTFPDQIHTFDNKTDTCMRVEQIDTFASKTGTPDVKTYTHDYETDSINNKTDSLHDKTHTPDDTGHTSAGETYTLDDQTRTHSVFDSIALDNGFWKPVTCDTSASRHEAEKDKPSTNVSVKPNPQTKISGKRKPPPVAPKPVVKRDKNVDSSVLTVTHGDKEHSVDVQVSHKIPTQDATIDATAHDTMTPTHTFESEAASYTLDTTNQLYLHATTSTNSHDTLSMYKGKLSTHDASSPPFDTRNAEAMQTGASADNYPNYQAHNATIQTPYAILKPDTTFQPYDATSSGRDSNHQAHHATILSNDPSIQSYEASDQAHGATFSATSPKHEIIAATDTTEVKCGDHASLSTTSPVSTDTSPSMYMLPVSKHAHSGAETDRHDTTPPESHTLTSHDTTPSLVHTREHLHESSTNDMYFTRTYQDKTHRTLTRPPVIPSSSKDETPTSIDEMHKENSNTHEQIIKERISHMKAPRSLNTTKGGRVHEGSRAMRGKHKALARQNTDTEATVSKPAEVRLEGLRKDRERRRRLDLFSAANLYQSEKWLQPEPSTVRTVENKKDRALMVAAIDFGTCNTGYAFCMKETPDSINGSQWQGSVGAVKMKTPTVVLLDHTKQIDSFGIEARDKYKNLMQIGEHRKWYLFENFKMKLFVKEGPLQKDMKLEDATGKTMKALDVFSTAICYIKQHLLASMFSDPTLVSASIVKEEEIHWVLTIPAIWNDASKQFMRTAAVQAGISDDMLTLALEPEAASLYCKQEFGNTTLKAGCRYMVLDIGGGTADITCHEVNADGTLTEIHRPSGGAFGGTLVDNKFIGLLNRLFGADVISKFKKENMEMYWEFVSYFEIKKESFTGRDPMKLKVPVQLRNLFTATVGHTVEESLQQSPLKHLIHFQRDKFVLSEKLAKSLFDEAVTQICNTVSELLADSVNMSYIALVGGFSESKYLQSILQERVDIPILYPSVPSVAVLKGAVSYGVNPTAIQSRVCKYTYGIARLMKFKPHHKPEKKITIGGVEYCDDLFNKHIEIGTKVSVYDDAKEHEYFPSTDHMAHASLEVYASTRKDPKYVDEKDCTLVGLVVVDIDTKGDIWSKILVKLMFGGTELKLQVRDVRNNVITNAKMDFLG